ncbi:MAG TPA: hypothetical protein VN688_05365 [Gemmataceae bacterium]|nr:hypothetical protein [Gemmataceae bacterium]
MWNRETWNKILGWMRKVRMAPQLHRCIVHYAKPELEWLDQRIVPTNVACTFTGAVGSAWSNPLNWAGAMPDDTGTDTAAINPGAACVLDQADEVKIAGLTVNGSLTTKSDITILPDGTLPGGTGTTSVSSTGLLTVATPDLPNTSSTLETTTLNTAANSATNLSIGDGATVEIDNAGTLSGTTSITGLLDAKNIDAFSGAIVALNGPGSVGGAGQMEAGIKASININGLCTILTGDPVGSALKDGDFFVNGELDIDTDLNPDGHITLNPGGTIGGTGDLSVVAEFTFLGGTLGPAGGTTIESSGDFKTDGGGTKTLANDLTNMSAFTDLNGTGTLSIASGVTYLNAAGTTEVELPSISGAGTFNNDANGTLTIKTPTTTTTTISSLFANTGTLQTEGGELALVSGSGMDTLDGTLSLGDDLTLTGALSSPTGLILNAGLGHLKIGDDIHYVTGSLDLSGGGVLDGNVDLTGFGTLTSGDTVYNNGKLTVDLGSTSSLAAYQQSSTATLTVQADALGPYSAILKVIGNAQLSGTLDMDFGGDQPASGSSFTVLTAGSIGAHFDSTPPDMTTQYGPTSVTVTQN